MLTWPRNNEWVYGDGIGFGESIALHCLDFYYNSTLALKNVKLKNTQEDFSDWLVYASPVQTSATD